MAEEENMDTSGDPVSAGATLLLKGLSECRFDRLHALALKAIGSCGYQDLKCMLLGRRLRRIAGQRNYSRC